MELQGILEPFEGFINLEQSQFSGVQRIPARETNMKLPAGVNLLVDVLLRLEVDGLESRLHPVISTSTAVTIAKTLPSLQL